MILRLSAHADGNCAYNSFVLQLINQIGFMKKMIVEHPGEQIYQVAPGLKRLIDLWNESSNQPKFKTAAGFLAFFEVTARRASSTVPLQQMLSLFLREIAQEELKVVEKQRFQLKMRLKDTMVSVLETLVENVTTLPEHYKKYRVSMINEKLQFAKHLTAFAEFRKHVESNLIASSQENKSGIKENWSNIKTAEDMALVAFYFADQKSLSYLPDSAVFEFRENLYQAIKSCNQKNSIEPFTSLIDKTITATKDKVPAKFMEDLKKVQTWLLEQKVFNDSGNVLLPKKSNEALRTKTFKDVINTLDFLKLDRNILDFSYSELFIEHAIEETLREDTVFNELLAETFKNPEKIFKSSWQEKLYKIGTQELHSMSDWAKLSASEKIAWINMAYGMTDTIFESLKMIFQNNLTPQEHDFFGMGEFGFGQTDPTLQIKKIDTPMKRIIASIKSDERDSDEHSYRFVESILPLNPNMLNPFYKAENELAQFWEKEGSDLYFNELKLTARGGFDQSKWGGDTELQILSHLFNANFQMVRTKEIINTEQKTETVIDTVVFQVIDPQRKVQFTFENPGVHFFALLENIVDTAKELNIQLRQLSDESETFIFVELEKEIQKQLDAEERKRKQEEELLNRAMQLSMEVATNKKPKSTETDDEVTVTTSEPVVETKSTETEKEVTVTINEPVAESPNKKIKAMELDDSAQEVFNIMDKAFINRQENHAMSHEYSSHSLMTGSNCAFLLAGLFHAYELHSRTDEATACDALVPLTLALGNMLFGETFDNAVSSTWNKVSNGLASLKQRFFSRTPQQEEQKRFADMEKGQQHLKLD